MQDIKTIPAVKFLLLSMTGILLFFIPVINGKIPVVFLIDWSKTLAGAHLKDVAVISSLFLLISLTGSALLKNKRFIGYHEQDAPLKQAFFAAGIVVVVMVCLNVNLPFIRNPEIGGRILPMASTVFLTIALAGTLVIFVMKSGIVEFISVLMEPVMRPVFCLPGEAAVNMISSFISSASVGVYFTEQYYKRNVYTTRQACAIVTNFSVISVGYIGVLASIAGIGEYYGVLLVSSFSLVLLMGAIMIRIPPLSCISDTYLDQHAKQDRPVSLRPGERFEKALRAGIEKSEEFTLEALWQNGLQALVFAQKTIGVMIPTVVFVLVLAYDTSLFQWIGRPFIPVIELLGIPDAAKIAPSVLMGIVEISLPSILAAGQQVAAESAFFVVQLSIVQIIFFSEAGNAILGSRIPLTAGKLVLLFLVRTMIAMPLVAVLTHLLF